MKRSSPNTSINSLLLFSSRFLWGQTGPIVEKVDNAINRINLDPLYNAIGFPNTQLIRWIVIYSLDKSI